MSDNTTPERVTLIVTRDGRVNSVLGHGTIGAPRMDADAVEYVRADILRDLANRKPVGDGEVVVRLTREEAQELANLAELPIEETPWGATTRVRTPLSDKLRAALDQGGSDE